MDRTTYAVDLAKNVMQLHWIDAQTGEIGRKKLSRAKLLEYFARLRSNKDDAAGLRALRAHRAQIDEQLPAPMQRLVDVQLRALADIEQHIDQLEAEIAAAQRQLSAALELSRVPGIGLLGSTALAATLGDGSGWKSGRAFAASLGMVPAHSGTGGKSRIGHLSKRGDPYLRTLLMHGARAVIQHGKHKPQWLERLLARRPLNVVVAALANKMARTAWALVAHHREYQRDWQGTGSKGCVAQAAAA